MVRWRSARVIVAKPRPNLALATVGERHFAAIGRADAHRLEVAERAALLLGIAHHDADVVAAALDALRFFAEERLAHLAAEVLQREPERLGLRR